MNATHSWCPAGTPDACEKSPTEPPRARLRPVERHPAVLRASLGILLLAPVTSPAAADMVHDGRGTFTNVTIKGIVDDALRFEMPDGRLLSRPAVEIQWITVSKRQGLGSAPLSRAEQFWTDGHYAKAVAHYAEVRATAKVRWMRDFAAMRSAMAFDRLGQFNEALEAYLELAPRHAILAKAVTPRKLPARGTRAAADALERIAEAARRPQPADVSVTLRDLRKRIQRGEGTLKSRPNSGRKKSAAKRTPTRGKKRKNGKRKPPARPLAPIDQARKAISDGDLDAAADLVADGLAAAREKARPAWRIVEAELKFAREDYVGSGLAAMRVVALYPASDEKGAALYWAGRSYAALGRQAKAMELFAECLKQRKLSTTLRQRAEARIEASFTRGEPE